MASDTIRHYELKILFDMWKPQEQLSNKEIDDMISMLREKKLLAHLGGVKSILTEVKE